jgi:hypothetical protein
MEARYTIQKLDAYDGAWTDITEARPRCRVRATNKKNPVSVLVKEDGQVEIEGTHEIDYYEKKPKGEK